MREQIFADAIGRIIVTGTTVRLDFTVIVPDDDQSGKDGKVTLCQRVIMPIEGFMSSLLVIQDCVKGMSQSGADARTDDAARHNQTVTNFSSNSGNTGERRFP